MPQESAQKVSKRIQRIRGKYLSVYREHGKLGLYAVHKIVSDYAESIKTYSENEGKESLRTWRRRKETLGDIKVCIYWLIITRIKIFFGFFLSTLYGMD